MKIWHPEFWKAHLMPILPLPHKKREILIGNERDKGFIYIWDTS